MNNNNAILKVKNIVKSYPIYSTLFHIKITERKVLHNVSFDLISNTVLGVLGPSGVGKTTLVKIICGIEEPDYGEIILENKNIKEYTKQQLATKIQILFQNPYSMLNPKFKIGFLIKERIKQYFKLNNYKVNNEVIDNKITELLEATKLQKNILDMYPYQLSGGQRQRVATLSVLCLYPKILILDEPLSAMDISLRAQMLNFFVELKEKFSLSYIFVTHDKDVAEYFCDYILTLYEDGSYEIEKT